MWGYTEYMWGVILKVYTAFGQWAKTTEIKHILNLYKNGSNIIHAWDTVSACCVVVVFREPYWDELLHSGMYFADKSIIGPWIIAHLLSGNTDCVPKLKLVKITQSNLIKAVIAKKKEKQPEKK